MLVEEIEEDSNKWEAIWTRRLDSVKMSLLPKAAYKFCTVPIKISLLFLTNKEQML